MIDDAGTKWQNGWESVFTQIRGLILITKISEFKYFFFFKKKQNQEDTKNKDHSGALCAAKVWAVSSASPVKVFIFWSICEL